MTYQYFYMISQPIFATWANSTDVTEDITPFEKKLYKKVGKETGSVFRQKKKKKTTF